MQRENKMDVKDKQTRILVVLALILCASVVFHSMFYVKEPDIPAVVRIDTNSEDLNCEDKIEEDSEKNQNCSRKKLEQKNSKNKEEVSKDQKNSENKDSENEDEINQDQEEQNSKKININTATEEELAGNLPGVGKSTAKLIVDKREELGGFSDIAQLKSVKGIGKKKFEKIENFICV